MKAKAMWNRSRGPYSWALLRWLVAVVLSAMASVAVATETLEEIQHIQSDAYKSLLDLQFSDINSMAARYSGSKARLADGRWKLSFVFFGLMQGLPERDAAAWDARLALIDRWVAETPTDSTPYLAKASFLIAYAWDARGTGYANTVKTADWQIFRERISQARKVLERSATISKKSPLWYECMQQIATAQSWSEDDFLHL